MVEVVYEMLGCEQFAGKLPRDLPPYMLTPGVGFRLNTQTEGISVDRMIHLVIVAVHLDVNSNRMVVVVTNDTRKYHD